MNPGLFFWLVLRSATLSTGGSGNIPILHDDLVGHGFASEQQFAESLAVGQISPGPSGLWVVSLGYLLGGWINAALALVAVTIPPLLILVVEKLYRRHEKNPAVEGFVHGLGLAVVAVFATVMAGLLHASSPSLVGWLLAFSAFLAALSGRVPIVLIILVAALFGVVLG